MTKLKGFVEIKFRKLHSNFLKKFPERKHGKTRVPQHLIHEYLTIKGHFENCVKGDKFWKTSQIVKVHTGKPFLLCQRVEFCLPKHVFPSPQVLETAKLSIGQVILSYR